MTPRQKYLIYQAYHEYKHERVFPMDLATALFDEHIDPSDLEDIFDEGLTPSDLTGDDENYETPTQDDEDKTSVPDEIQELIDALLEIYINDPKRAQALSMDVTFSDGTEFVFHTLDWSVIEDLTLLKNSLKDN